VSHTSESRECMVVLQVFLIAQEQRDLKCNMLEILNIAKSNGSNRPEAADAEVLPVKPVVTRQSTSSRHIQEPAALSALLLAVQGLEADINVIKLAVATNDSTVTGKSCSTASKLALNATVAADAHSTAARATGQSAFQTKPLQQSARSRTAYRGRRGAAQATGSPTPSPTPAVMTNVHNMCSVQEVRQKAFGVPSTEPPCSTGKPTRNTARSATVLAVKAAVSTEDSATFPTMEPIPNERLIRRDRAETFSISRGGGSAPPTASVWDSVVLVPGGRQPLPFPSSVWHSERIASGQPTHWHFHSQKARSASWAVALAAAVDNDQDMAQADAW
jgi:hypothetical protein